MVGADLDPNAVANARANGVEAYAGDLFAPLPADLGPADVIVAVVPYVPRRALPLLQRDTFRFETALAYDGGEEGLDILIRVLEEAPARLKPGGALVLEVGGSQAGDLDGDIARLRLRRRRRDHRRGRRPARAGAHTPTLSLSAIAVVDAARDVVASWLL